MDIFPDKNSVKKIDEYHREFFVLFRSQKKSFNHFNSNKTTKQSCDGDEMKNKTKKKILIYSCNVIIINRLLNRSID